MCKNILSVEGLSGRLLAGVALKSGEQINADLVVDASGRGSHTPQWLRTAGVAGVEEPEVVSSGITYASRRFRRPADWPKVYSSPFSVCPHKGVLSPKSRPTGPSCIPFFSLLHSSRYSSPQPSRAQDSRMQVRCDRCGVEQQSAVHQVNHVHGRCTTLVGGVTVASCRPSCIPNPTICMCL